MQRTHFAKRPNYEQRLKDIGFEHFSLPSGPEKAPYWQEGVCYVFKEAEIDRIEEATQTLHDMSVEMVRQMVGSGDYPDYFHLSDLEKSLIEQSWKRGDKSLLGRFDLAYNAKTSEIKMLEYNGDTPVSILEASIAQWDYIQEASDIPEPMRIQYNMIDEQLIETWNKYFNPNDTVHFAHADSFRSEDYCNLMYLMDTAYRAKLQVKDITMENIGHARNKTDPTDIKLIDLDDQNISNLFKLYPWEWIFKTVEVESLKHLKVNWMEPVWKALLSNKAMLVKMWELFPNHPYLLEAHASESNISADSGMWCKKAIHGREGANVYQYDASTKACVLGQGSHIVDEYSEWGYMYQNWHQLQNIDGYYPILGSWVIGDKACGMSVREDRNPITGNDAFFACHVFIPREHPSYNV